MSSPTTTSSHTSSNTNNTKEKEKEKDNTLIKNKTKMKIPQIQQFDGVCNLTIQDLTKPVNRDLLLDKDHGYHCRTCGYHIGRHVQGPQPPLMSSWLTDYATQKFTTAYDDPQKFNA